MTLTGLMKRAGFFVREIRGQKKKSNDDLVHILECMIGECAGNKEVSYEDQLEEACTDRASAECCRIHGSRTSAEGP